MATVNAIPANGTPIKRGSTVTITVSSDFSMVPNIWNGISIYARKSGGYSIGNYSADITQLPQSFTVNMKDLIAPDLSYTLADIVDIDVDVTIYDRNGPVYGDFVYPVYDYTVCGAPTEPTLDTTLSREPVRLSWGAGSDGMDNIVTGYDVQRRESSNGNNWGSWENVPDSPVTTTEMYVSPPNTAGNYYQYQVRTRGSAGSNYYSGWVTSDNTKLRRKWDAFGAWTDATLTAGVSVIRAVHLTQLQERVNSIRTFLGMSACSFTAITPGVTKIAQWAAYIREIRDAIDEITTDHEAWQALETGKPRAAQITQMRSIVDSL